MIKKPITFSDLDGNQITKDFYFHLSKAEFTEMELSTPGGGLEAHLRRILAQDDRKEIIKTYKELILAAYGVRNDDGLRFEKTKAHRDWFEQTDAFAVLFFELLTQPGSIVDFLRGVMPADLVAKLPTNLEDLISSGKLELSEAVPAEPAKPKVITDYTEAELLAMSNEQFDGLLSAMPGKNIPKEILMIAMRRK